MLTSIKHGLYVALLLLSVSTSQVFAGGQIEEPLSNSVKTMMQKTISDSAAPRLVFANEMEGRIWMREMSERLQKRMPDKTMREDFLRTVHYEATRAGLDPQLVLGLIQVESGFKKYAVSSVGARGFMQVMPFWVRSIGAPDHNLFHLRLNLRYGCTILRHYLDIERGDLYRALGRYNGSLGQPQYPNMVVGAWRKNWTYIPLDAK
ncbi:MAG TPA: lytic transglycosylase domain-containing protein [Methylophilaceae bacterium]|nr:lytic transglycosylase domain-containing protein [Methylophilaceae bacterium]